MGKKVLFIVIENGNKKSINDDTKKSINTNLGKEDALVFVKIKDEGKNELYYQVKDEANKIINDVNNFDYVCAVPNGSILNNEAKSIFNDYYTEREDVNQIFLPFVMFQMENQPVILNKHIWNSLIASSAGVLDIDLALKQVDSTIFGAFIPTNLFFNSELYNSDLKYYQQYHLLNHLSDGDNLTLGIPKLLLTIHNWDFKLEGVSNEEKVKFFNMAREKWMNPVSSELQPDTN